MFPAGGTRTQGAIGRPVLCILQERGKTTLSLINMLSHSDIWRAIDTLARVNGLSTSGLARKAGLDPTSFNRSKRTTAAGRPRWPSSESLAKVLNCTGTTFEEFARLVSGRKNGWRVRVPLLDLNTPRGLAHFSDTGLPRGEAWRKCDIPGIEDEDAFALRIGEATLLSGCRRGDVAIISPASRIQARDRVVAQRGDGLLLAGELRRRSGRGVMLRAPGATRADTEELTLPREEIRWMARVHCVLMGTARG